MGKKLAKQDKLPGMPDLNGKMVTVTDIEIAVPEIVSSVEVRQLDNGDFRLIKGETTGTGATLPEAIKAFKREYLK